MIKSTTLECVQCHKALLLSLLWCGLEYCWQQALQYQWSSNYILAKLTYAVLTHFGQAQLLKALKKEVNIVCVSKLKSFCSISLLVDVIDFLPLWFIGQQLSTKLTQVDSISQTLLQLWCNRKWFFYNPFHPSITANKNISINLTRSLFNFFSRLHAHVFLQLHVPNTCWGSTMYMHRLRSLSN